MNPNMKTKKLKIAAVLSAIAIAASLTVYAAYDSSKDPLVSLSYLNDVFRPSLKVDLDNITKSVDALQKQVDALSNEYAVVTLNKDQRITADAACEFVILSGAATVRCTTAGAGIIDCTDGVILLDGQSIPVNHKLLVPDNGDGRGITAADTVQLLIKGGYTIG